MRRTLAKKNVSTLMNRGYCDGVARRDFVQIGALMGMGLGMNLSMWGSVKESAPDSPGKAKAAIFVRLMGGPSHMDTFDMKPGAPSTHRGEFKERSTLVPGIRMCEHLPKLAMTNDKFSVIRGISHSLAAHELGQKYLASGNRPIASLQYPAYGAVVAREIGSPNALPPFIAIPNQSDNPTGYIGMEYGPFETGRTPQKGQPMRVRGLTLNQGMTMEDIQRRYNLVQRYDNAFGTLAQEDKLLAGMDEFSRKAYQMIRSREARDAFDLSREPESISSLFGESGFSQSCLLATRLVESGVPFVTVSFGGWDTHQDNFSQLKEDNLPQLDDGLGGLFEALQAKSLWESTVVFVTGEFGRTPKINERGGRDHYPRAMVALMGGGGVHGGQVIGESDARGEGPKDWIITPDDLAATLYRCLGIDHRKEYLTPTGRPVMLVRNGNPIQELLA